MKRGLPARTFRGLAALTLWLGLLGAAPPLALALRAQEAPEELFAETLDVEVVNVEVRVIDRKGRPITGLAREDFELFEDGRRVEIAHFYEVRGDHRAEPGEGLPRLPEGDPDGRGTAPPT
ncbi:MAG TPA: hypothetical protein VM599_02400, partial [Thermoanaerobaculia bacterium]|nr:hypothetical protein [Thermoanaerobaculia bacterium]